MKLEPNQENLKALEPREKKLLRVIKGDPGITQDQLAQKISELEGIDPPLSSGTIGNDVTNLCRKIGIEAKHFKDKKPELIDWYNEAQKTPKPIEDPIPVTNWPKPPLSEAHRGPQEAFTTPVSGEVIQPNVHVFTAPPDGKRKERPIKLIIGIGSVLLIVISFSIGVLIGRSLDGEGPVPTVTTAKLSMLPTNTPQPSMSPTPVFTLEPTPTLYGFQSEQYPAPGTTIKASESFTKAGIFVTVPTEFIDVDSDFIGFNVSVINKRASQYILRYQLRSFHLYDDLGNEFTRYKVFDNATFEEVIQTTLDENDLHHISFGRNITPISFRGVIDPQANKLIFVVDELAGMTNMIWEFDLR